MKTYNVMIAQDHWCIIQAEEALVDTEHNVVNFVTADESGRIQTVAQWNMRQIIGWIELTTTS